MYGVLHVDLYAWPGAFLVGLSKQIYLTQNAAHLPVEYFLEVAGAALVHRHLDDLLLLYGPLALAVLASVAGGDGLAPPLAVPANTLQKMAL